MMIVNVVSRLFVRLGAGLAIALALIALAATEPAAAQEVELTAMGLPVEGPLDAFLGEPVFDLQTVFENGNRVREPYLAVALDGTLLALQNYDQRLRRSEDGGETWGPALETPIAFRDTNLIVDETTGDVLSLRMWDGQDRLWRSRDHGKTWTEERIVLNPNEVMKWLEQTGLKTRGTSEGGGQDTGQYYLHGNAGESGVTLRHGPHKGRLLVTATFRPHAEAHPSDRDPVDAIYSLAVYSDDGGAMWQVSGFFPEGYTEEAALVELSGGRIYYNSRSHLGYYDSGQARELPEESALRRVAWSDDGGHTWDDLEINRVLPDGGGYGRGYGMKAGLARLPVQGRDILLYSNSDTAGQARERMTVWASFDGGTTWPLKRLVYEGPGAYSSMVAGRPGTSSEGQIYLLFEGAEAHHYGAMQVARFNLSWLLGGAATGDGTVPDWATR